MRDTVNADDLPVAGVRVIGHGPRTVFVSHGWIADSTLFYPVLAHIDPSEFTVALVDHRGYGARRAETTGLDLDTSTTEMLGVADALGWTTFSVIGHSMGALVAQKLAADHPHRIEAMELVAPVPASGATISAERRDERLRIVADPEQRRQMIATNAAATDELVDAITGMSLATTTMSGLAGFLHSFGTSDFADRLAGCTIPTLILVGEHDPAVPPSLVSRTLLRWLPHAALITLPTGHYPMQQLPAELWTSCSRFLRQNANESNS